MKNETENPAQPEIKPAAPHPAQPEIKPEMVTLRHPGGLGPVMFGMYETEKDYYFNSKEQHDLIAQLKSKGFILRG